MSTYFFTAFQVIAARELIRFVHQRGRFLSALVRPLVWLLIFAAGFRAALGVSIVAPYQTYITYEIYILPGLCGMILLFNSMQSSLSLVYDRELGSIRLLLTAPLPRWWLLFSKLAAGTFVGCLQAYAFLTVAALFGVTLPLVGYALALPALVLSGFMLGALGLMISSVIKRLENFAAVMNFVIFPMFFLSSALYPLWRMKESSKLLHDICALNPFTHAVELIRFSAYLQLSLLSLIVVSVCGVVFFLLADIAYDPARITSFVQRGRG